MLGTYTLSHGYYDAYYKKAQKVRALVIADFKKIFEDVDLIAAPTAPTPALTLGEFEKYPFFGEMMDVLNEPAAVAGIPAINIPVGTCKENLPIGLQLMGPQPPTPTPDFGLDLPKEQGPGIDNTDPETLSVEELVNRSWIDELHIVDRVDDQNQCDNLKLSRVILAPAGDNLLGITYKVDFSAWAEHYVGPCPKVMLVDSDRHVNHPSITRGENKIVGFSDNISAYEPEIVDEAPPDKDDERPRTDYEDITITDFAHRGSAEIVAEQTCRGETPDYNNFIMENDSGTYRILGVNIYHASYTGPCEMIKIVSEGVKPGMHIWGVSGYVLTGYKDAFAPIGPPAP